MSAGYRPKNLRRIYSRMIRRRSSHEGPPWKAFISGRMFTSASMFVSGRINCLEELRRDIMVPGLGHHPKGYLNHCECVDWRFLGFNQIQLLDERKPFGYQTSSNAEALGPMFSMGICSILEDSHTCSSPAANFAAVHCLYEMTSPEDVPIRQGEVMSQ